MKDPPHHVSVFDPPGDSELLVVTHILELPRYLPLEDRRAMVLYEKRDDIFVDWPDAAKAHLVLGPKPPKPGQSPVTRLVFRQVSVRTRLPLEAADRAYGDWTAPLLPQRGALARKVAFRRATRRGFTVPATVIAATRFVARTAWPETSDDQLPYLRRELDACLDLVNDLILATGLLAADPRLLPIAFGDLPPLCPVIIEATPTIVRAGTTFVYEVHPDIPTVVEQPLDAERSQLAFEIAEDAYYDNDPFFLFYEFIQAASAAYFGRRYSTSIASVGTAVEVLVSRVIHEASRLLEEPPSRAESILQAGLKNAVASHLSSYLNTPIDLTDSESPFGRWWQDGYLTRNRVVHEGYAPDDSETARALRQALAITKAVQEGLQSRQATKPLGDVLLTEFTVPEEVDGR